MPAEIERKFRVQGHAWCHVPGVRLVQGYLNRDKARTVRIRLAGDEAFLTIKGLTVGAARLEFEYPIPFDDAQSLLALCEKPLIEKVRHLIEYQGFTWEIDEFFGDNAGLVIAEIELESEGQAFPRPDWLGREVTADPRYFNSNLASQPYRNWRASDG